MPLIHACRIGTTRLGCGTPRHRSAGCPDVTRTGFRRGHHPFRAGRSCRAVAAALLLAVCSLPLRAGSDETQATQHPDAAGATLSETAAQAIILAWAREQLGGEVYEPIEIFQGDFTGDGVADALAWVLYPSGGNSDFLRVALFRGESGRLVHHRNVDDVFGAEPRDVVFAPGRITLTTTMPRPDDPRCCPTGSRDWVIDTN